MQISWDHFPKAEFQLDLEFCISTGGKKGIGSSSSETGFFPRHKKCFCYSIRKCDFKQYDFMLKSHLLKPNY